MKKLISYLTFILLIAGLLNARQSMPEYIFEKKFMNTTGWTDSDEKWKVIETRHFAIYFQDYPYLHEQASYIADLLETSYRVISYFARKNDNEKYAVILIGYEDYSNGLANPVTGKIQIWTQHKRYKFRSSKSWLPMVASHELTHLIHLRQRHGAGNVLYYMLGNLYLPDTVNPYWFTEGVAQIGSSVAGYDCWDDVRQALLNVRTTKPFRQEEILGLEQAPFPGSEAIYNYGFSFLRKQYASREDLLTEVFRKRGTPLVLVVSFEKHFSGIIDKSLSKADKEWKYELKRDLKNDKDTFSEIKIPSKKFHDIRHVSRFKNGYVFIGQESIMSNPAIYIWNLDSKDVKCAYKNRDIGNRVESDFDGKKIFFLENYNKGYRTLSRLKVLDLESKKTSILFKESRIIDFAIHCDSKGLSRLAIVVNENGIQSIQISENFTEPYPLYQEPYRYSFEQPVFSKDGSKLAYLRLDRDKPLLVSCLIHDFKTGSQKEFSKKFLSSPFFSSDDRYLYAQGSNSAFPELIKFNINEETKETCRLRNGGIYNAFAIDDSTALATGFSENGMSLFKIFLNRKGVSKKEAKAGSPRKLTFSKPTDARDYNFLNSISPKYWYPYYFKNNQHHFGYNIYLEDDLNRHELFMNGGMVLDSKKAEFGFSYVNSAWKYPIIIQGSTDLHADKALQDSLYFWRNNWGSLSLNLPLSRYVRLTPSFTVSKIFGISEQERIPDEWGLPPDIRLIPSMALIYNNTESWNSWKKGQFARIRSSLYQEWKKNSRQSKNVLTFANYIPMPISQHTLSLTGETGYAYSLNSIWFDNTFSFGGEAFRFPSYKTDTFQTERYLYGSINYTFPIKYSLIRFWQIHSYKLDINFQIEGLKYRRLFDDEKNWTSDATCFILDDLIFWYGIRLSIGPFITYRFDDRKLKEGFVLTGGLFF
ncbi:MAG: hypothetical protein JXA60_01905 [Candidatus Coatesbacteria bacterium]|nr:hypothetical protein [Candidatus Coatesbacteria bacterium]